MSLDAPWSGNHTLPNIPEVLTAEDEVPDTQRWTATCANELRIGTNDSKSVSVFKERLLGILSALTGYPKETPYPAFKSLPRNHRAMSTGFYSILNASLDTRLASTLIQYIPPYVQTTLGMGQPTFEELLRMPSPTPGQLHCWLVYVDCTVRWHTEEDTTDCPKRGHIVRRGKYVGSSVDSRGGRFRIEKHRQVAITKESSEKKQRHHEELCQIGTDANLRILAAFEMEDQLKAYVQLLETIFVVFLGTFAGRERTRTHNPEACCQLYDRMRLIGRIPETEGDGLNGALSIHQGMAGVSIGWQFLNCLVCQRELPPNTSIRNASRLVEPGNLMGPRRCGPCERVFALEASSVAKENANEQSSSIAFQRQRHQLWLAQGNADVCGNPACRAPPVKGTGFRGWQSESRCMTCFAHLTFYRKRGIGEDISERQPTEHELASRRYTWTKADDAIVLSHRKQGLRFREICVQYFPHLTAQIVKERCAVLSSSISRRSKKATKTKSPDWTTEELAILQTAIHQGAPASKVTSLLPSRTAGSICTKMSWLRKGHESRCRDQVNTSGLTETL